MRFDVRDHIGYFIYPDKRFDAVHEAFDALHQRSMSYPRYTAALTDLIAQQPDFIDLHVQLAHAWQRQGKSRKALDAALAGLAIGNRCIPEGFDGQIVWGIHDNRPFLSALEAAITAYIRMRRHKDAVVLIEKLLAYNPDDNQGVRYLHGSELLRIGKVRAAQAVFAEYAQTYPAYHYEHALSHLMQHAWADAVTALRHGFCTNPYIAEILSGNRSPTPLERWHGHSFERPDYASHYMAMYGELWERNVSYATFVRWAFNHSRVLAERAKVAACREQIYWEHDPAVAGPLIERFDRLLDHIDPGLSVEITAKKVDREGNACFPWPDLTSAWAAGRE